MAVNFAPSNGLPAVPKRGCRLFDASVKELHDRRGEQSKRGLPELHPLQPELEEVERVSFLGVFLTCLCLVLALARHPIGVLSTKTKTFKQERQRDRGHEI